MLKQQIIGVINISLPIILLYQVYPSLFQTHMGIAICSLIIGLLLYYLNRRSAKNMLHAFKFSPSIEFKERFEYIIIHCGLDPQKVPLFYAYTHESIAMAVFNSIILDPIVWSSLESDPDVVKVITIFEQFINPSLSISQKQRLSEIKEIFSHDAQTFIFKHELAHVYYHFSTKKLIIIGLIGFIASYISIITALSLIPINGILAICVGIMVGCIGDLLLTYLSNAIFKVQEEKKADRFAAHYSSSQEINAAADFFEQHQQILDGHPDLNNPLRMLPSIFATGHPNGRTRALYLRAIASQKSNAHTA